MAKMTAVGRQVASQLMLLVLVLGLAQAAAAANVPVVLFSDYRAQVDFDFVVSELWTLDESAVVARETLYVLRGRELSGDTVATLGDVAPGFYRLVVRLLDDQGVDVALQKTNHEATAGDAPAVVSIVRPARTATKSAALWLDADEDGEPRAGDVMRYAVEIQGPASLGTFVDQPGPGTRLIAGTVFTSHGAVARGNSPGDTDVAVFLGVVDSPVAIVEFDAELVAEVVNQGTLVVPGAGTVGTDDPDTAVPLEATVTALAGFAELTSCRAELRASQEELDGVLADPDADGIAALRDRCVETPPGTAVDWFGCSRAQFCREIAVDTQAGQRACTYADWRDDEPSETSPGDCRVAEGSCQPTS